MRLGIQDDALMSVPSNDMIPSRTTLPTWYSKGQPT